MSERDEEPGQESRADRGWGCSCGKVRGKSENLPDA